MSEIKLSKRKLESYKRAEKVAQQVRFEMVNGCTDVDLLSDLVINWMSFTGNVKYEKPKEPKVRHSKKWRKENV